MAWEWLAPAAAVAGAFVGGGTTWLVGRGARRHAETIAGRSHEHTERLAREARRHKRLEEAYVELVEMAERAGQWTSRLTRLWDTDPPQPMPRLPSEDEQVRVRARVRAYGSAEVKRLMDEYIDCINELLVTQQIIQFAQSQPLHAGEMEQQHRLKMLQELQPAEAKKRRELTDRVWSELGAELVS